LNIISIFEEFPPYIREEIGKYAKEVTKRLPKHDIHPKIFSKNSGKEPVSNLWKAMPVYRPKLIDISDTIPLLAPLDVQTWTSSDQHYFLETVLFNHLAAYHVIQTLYREKGRSYSAVTAHDWESAIAGLLIKSELNIPFVFHLHSTGQGKTCRESQAIRKIEDMALLTADAVVVPSYAIRDELSCLGYKHEKINVIYDGADPDTYDPALVSGDMIREFRSTIGVMNHPMILYIGRLTKAKGIDELVKAMPEIIREIPDARLVIAGEGELEEKIHILAEDNGISNHIIMHTRNIPGNERLLYYAASDCVVFPSKYESSGILCAEAMAMEKPVVVGAAGVSGLKELIVSDGQEQCGFHINPWDTGDIAKYAIEILKYPDISEKFGKKGRERVSEYFTWNITAEKTADLYHKVAE